MSNSRQGKPHPRQHRHHRLPVGFLAVYPELSPQINGRQLRHSCQHFYPPDRVVFLVFSREQLRDASRREEHFADVWQSGDIGATQCGDQVITADEDRLALGVAGDIGFSVLAGFHQQVVAHVGLVD